MKTIKELEKEIEELQKKAKEGYVGGAPKFVELKAALTQTKAIAEMIIEHRNIAQWKHPQGEMIITICDELLTKIRGDEK